MSLKTIYASITGSGKKSSEHEDDITKEYAEIELEASGLIPYY
jgi:hypothetical protein